MKLLSFLREKSHLFFKKLRDKNHQKEFVGPDFTIISSNCNGGVITHDLGKRFDSPFVNLWIKPKDYLKLLKNLQYYLDLKIHFIKENEINYPVGLLDDIKIYFQHYETEKQAEEKWEQRKNRIHYDNIFVLFSDRDGCTYDDLLCFDKLPYKHKVVFTHKKYKDIKSSVYIHGFENDDMVGICSEYRNYWFGKRYLDDFDYVSWLNG